MNLFSSSDFFRLTFLYSLQLFSDLIVLGCSFTLLSATVLLQSDLTSVHLVYCKYYIHGVMQFSLLTGEAQCLLACLILLLHFNFTPFIQLRIIVQRIFKIWQVIANYKSSTVEKCFVWSFRKLGDCIVFRVYILQCNFCLSFKYY